MRIPIENKRTSLDQATLDELDEQTVANFIYMNRKFLTVFDNDWTSPNKVPESRAPDNKGVKNWVARILKTGLKLGILEYKGKHGYRTTAKGKEYLGKEVN